MDLPTDKKLSKIIYEYEDGSRYVLTGTHVQTFQENVENASTVYIIHGGTFPPVNWREELKGS